MTTNIDTISGPQILLDVWGVLLAAEPGLSVSSDTLRGPKVLFLGEGQDDADETVRLLGTIPTATIEWRNTGRIVGEEFELTLVIDTRVTGASGPAAVARAIALADEIQVLFRDAVTGLPSGLTDSRVLQNYRVSGYTLETFPLEDKGYGCLYEMTLRVETRH